VKSLTSVVKNHVDYYSMNFEQELGRLIGEILKESWGKVKEKHEWLKHMQWRRLREEFLSTENIQWLLKKLDVKDDDLQSLSEALEARLKVHKENIRTVFEKRTKNLSLALGLVLCLFLNINAFTIWDTLYNDQLVRAKFASPESVESAQKLLETYDSEIKKLEADSKEKATQSGTEAEPEMKEHESIENQRDALNKQREALVKQISHFRGEAGFGMGRIWSGKVDSWSGFLYEFFGSLLTGILVSIGAPYWHDILRTLSARRQLRRTEAKKPTAT
jgi:hypothetical protein